MSIFEHLEHEWHDAEQHVSDWFHHHGDTITPDPPDQGALMSLASLAAELRATAENGVAKAEAGAAELHTLLDRHLPQIEALGELVDANPVFASAQNALHVPLEVLQGIAGLLDKLAAAHPQPEPVPVAQAPAEPVAEPAAA